MGSQELDTPEQLTQHSTIHDIGGFTLLFVTSISLCKNSVDFIGTLVFNSMFYDLPLLKKGRRGTGGGGGGLPWWHSG